MIRVLVADDQALVRAGICLLLRQEPDIEVVAEAEDGERAVEAVLAHRPDVALMDIRMPRVDGVHATRRILALPGQPTRVLVLTTIGRDDAVDACLQAGAAGYLLKDSPPEQLLAALRVVAAGEAMLDPAVTRRVISGFVAGHRPDSRLAAVAARLSPREREVLTLLCTGATNDEIARTLSVGVTTVKTHLSRMFMKIGVQDRVQAVVFAYESGVVRPSRGDA